MALILLRNGKRMTKHLSRSEEHTSELQSQSNLVCRLLLEKKKRIYIEGGVRLHGVGSFLAMPHSRICLTDYTRSLLFYLETRRRGARPHIFEALLPPRLVR